MNSHYSNNDSENPQGLELLRHSLLRQLSVALPASLSADTLTLGLHSGGFRLSADDLHTELLYLTQKGLIDVVSKTVSVSPTPRYRLSALGRDYLTSEGL